MLNNTWNQPSKFRTRNLIEINDEERGTYSTNNQSKVKTSMIRPCLWDCKDAYMHAKAAIVIPNKTAAGASAHNATKKVYSIFI